jgi:hypothetical protein
LGRIDCCVYNLCRLDYSCFNPYQKVGFAVWGKLLCMGFIEHWGVVLTTFPQQCRFYPDYLYSTWRLYMYRVCWGWIHRLVPLSWLRVVVLVRWTCRIRCFLNHLPTLLCSVRSVYTSALVVLLA